VKEKMTEGKKGKNAFCGGPLKPRTTRLSNGKPCAPTPFKREGKKTAVPGPGKVEGPLNEVKSGQVGRNSTAVEETNGKRVLFRGSKKGWEKREETGVKKARRECKNLKKEIVKEVGSQDRQNGPRSASSAWATMRGKTRKRQKRGERKKKKSEGRKSGARCVGKPIRGQNREKQKDDPHRITAWGGNSRTQKEKV